MKILINEKLVKRNARIGQITTFAALAVLAGGMYISFQRPDLFSWSLIALLLGFLASQIGIYFTNRWGRSPRPDQLLNLALKGLDKRYAFYHYVSPTSHLLVGPAGVWVLIPKTQKGKISYEHGRWRQRGGGFLATYLKIFAQDSIGRPDIEITAETDEVRRFLEKQLPEVNLPKIQAALVFLHPEADILIEEGEAPAPTMASKKLKDFIRKAAKDDGAAMTTIEQIQALFAQAEEVEEEEEKDK
ncbi:MAG: hypothetical protein JW862_19615 [Anaerolineales bacterium]|nr:hypothetical protein [Anaerolineales bacterium]